MFYSNILCCCYSGIASLPDENHSSNIKRYAAMVIYNNYAHATISQDGRTSNKIVNIWVKRDDNYKIHVLGTWLKSK